MTRHDFWCVRGVFTLLLLLFGSIASAQNTISGTLSLPVAMGDATGDYHFSVIARVANGTGAQVSATGAETIVDGTNSVAFTIPVPDDPDPSISTEKWRIDYVCNYVPSTNNCNGAARAGSYDGGNTAALQADALLLDVGIDHTGLAFPVIQADTITGTLSLPGARVAPAGGVDLTMRVRDSGGTFPLTDVVNIPEGSSSVDYQLNIAPAAGATRRVDYGCDSNCNGLIDRGFYVSNSEMSRNEEDAALLAAETNHASINLTVIPTNAIAGMVSLPSPLKAPAGGTQVRMTAHPVGFIGGSAQTVVTIPGGASSIPYVVEVEGNAGGVWRMEYNLDCSPACGDLVEFGFYNTFLTAIIFTEGSELSAAQDHANIDIEILDLKTIGGQILLPAGTANGDIGLTVSIANSDFSVVESVPVTILDTNSSASYQFEVARQAKPLTVEVSCNSNCGTFGPIAYYNSTGSVADSGSAEGIDGTQDHSNIDLPLLLPAALIGTISLPGGALAPSDFNIDVIASKSDESSVVRLSVIIAQNANSTTFDVPVSADPADSWSLRYDCQNPCPGFVNEAFYSSGGSLSTHTGADSFAGGSQVSGIDFELLDGHAIGGALFLPGGLTAGAGGASFRLTAFDPTFSEPYQTEDVTITAGGVSVPYSIDVPVNNAPRWTLVYTCLSDCTSLIELGYFNATGTVRDSDSASELAGNTLPASNKNIEILQAFTLSGELSLPNSALAPAGGIDFRVEAHNDTDPGVMLFDDVSISVNTHSTSYSVKTPASVSGNWILKYRCTSNCAGYASGYFASAGTAPIQSGATLLPVATDHPSKDMSVLESVTVSGSISLPAGLFAPAGGFSVGIELYDTVNASDNSLQLVIPEGQNSANYLIDLSPDPAAQWYARYNCTADATCNGYLDFAYYNVSGMVRTAVDSSLLAGGVGHSNVNLALVAGHSISGSVFLPSGTAPDGGVKVRINASDSVNNGFSDDDFVTITAGEASAAFHIDVPIDGAALWVVKYDCELNCDGVYKDGFYHSSGSVAVSTQAQELAGNTHHSAIDITMLSQISLSGALSLPNVANASTDIDLQLTVREPNTNYVGFREITILNGQPSAAFSIDIPAIVGSDFLVEYSCASGCAGFASNGYYKQGLPSVLEAADATLVNVNSFVDITNVNFSLIGENTISGILALPSGNAVGEIDFTVSVRDLNSNLLLTEPITMANGNSQQAFSLQVPGVSAANWQLDYRCDNNCTGLVTRGYYAPAGSVPSAINAVSLPGMQNHLGLVFDVIAMRQIGGTLFLPSSETAPIGGIDFRLTLRATPVPPNMLAAADVVLDSSIAEGASSLDFAFMQVPDASQTWQLGYQCTANCGAYVNGYFDTVPSPGTTGVPAEAFEMDGTSNFLSRDMTVLEGVPVSGSLSLPNGATADNGDIEVVFIALDNVNVNLVAISQTFTIAAGTSAVSYILNLPNVSSANWAIQYVCSNCDTYTGRGFYDVPATSPVQAGVDRLQVTAPLSNIDMTIIGTNTISGTVSLLQGRTAPAGGMDMQVNVFDTASGSSSAGNDTLISIPAGQSAIRYQVVVYNEPSAQWKVDYRCTAGCADSLLNGFYNVSGTVADIAQSSLLAGAINYNDIDLLVLDAAAEFNDDDGDGILNTDPDNCRFIPNPNQADANNNGVGDLCETLDGTICFPIKAAPGKAVLICL